MIPRAVPIPVYHVGGPHACGHVAFGVRRWHPLREHDFPAVNVVKLNGESPSRGEPVLCGACKNCVGFWELSYVEPTRSRVHPIQGVT